MKIYFAKIKNLIQNVNFFWQAIVTVFFTGLFIVLTSSVIFWFNLNQNSNSQTVDSRAEQGSALNVKKFSQVLDQIKTRSTELASTTANLPTMADPSR